ncbi:MAG: metal-dependent transcriptional regulator [Candidatus Omnitrophota bacterium]
MNISDRAQEVLEKYWIKNREEKKFWKMMIIFDDPVVDELTKSGFGKDESGSLKLTQKGWDEAHNCIRRHRLAECLMSNVFDIKKNKIHELGCKFEHALQRDVEENICTLLGHPDRCPHGKPIPKGPCCRSNKRDPRRLVLSLAECDVKDRGKIMYVKTDRRDVMNKLTSMGILPGLTIKLLRKSPAFLFQLGESQFAIDKNLAGNIHVKILR